MSEIASRLEAVTFEIERAKSRRASAFSAEDVTLVAVTKNHDVTAMREAIDAGVSTVGENRVQEAAKKYKELGRKVSWHLIGHLQTNKAKQAVKMFDLIHSVDSEHLLIALDREASMIRKVQDILIQVNLAREESKFGIFMEDLPFLLQKADAMKNVRLSGLMCIAPNFDDAEEARPLFRQMREIFEKLRPLTKDPERFRLLSMGMTGDYQVAIEEGANLVRIGTAIFGARQY